MYRFYSKPTGTSKVRVAVVGEYTGNTLGIAVARCSQKDTFIKRKGRAIAEGRLAKGKLYAAYNLKECDIVTFIEKAKAIAAEVSKQTSHIRVINDPATLVAELL